MTTTTKAMSTTYDDYDYDGADAEDEEKDEAALLDNGTQNDWNHDGVLHVPPPSPAARQKRWSMVASISHAEQKRNGHSTNNSRLSTI